MKMGKNSSKANETKKKLTIEELKAAAQSVKAEDALAKIVGGTLASCHTTLETASAL
ncbi:hypothetical protein SAMN05428949_4048 [Chitinophaga sp. YR627]|uniref:Uncharacterized protein n=1 Tax=Chitinophaga pinensis (strain ATCC 43595 / DSM 2588 / LMG 13176 / NBRC 15968 / NCIMB 11800 / UQM 2034) TaxID=485918 RepID=A0A979G115_CHIPD|nr:MULTISPECIES: hypothetical protein [Chitinophaga]ACU58766.1 hypothetical protein Cpin_1268 [Chitinophaga pinensis DSM 2588]SFN98675.1 hypothetical protein SAMN05428949_4048 [Chitinophaga sp. YR627]